MIRICPGGWTPETKHPEKVLAPENGQAPVGKVSHGICADCEAAIEREEQRLQEEEKR